MIAVLTKGMVNKVKGAKARVLLFLNSKPFQSFLIYVLPALNEVFS